MPKDVPLPPRRLLPGTFLLLVGLLVAGCDRGPDPQAIVDRAIDAHGGEALEHGIVEFDFRGRHFRAIRDGGRFRYERIFEDSSGTVRDVLTNDTLYRTIDDRPAALDERQRASVLSGVNSVIYFALLPFPLNDPAVQKRYLGPTTVAGEPYHEVEITFRPEGGGKDWEDRYVYWIHRDRHTMDYLAYTFDGGTRFRDAVNPRRVGDVRFADYLNYTAPALGDSIEGYDEALEQGGLEMVSEIVLENVRVRPLPEAGIRL